MKKSIAILMVLMFCVLAVAGCTVKQPAESPAPAAPKPRRPLRPEATPAPAAAKPLIAFSNAELVNAS